jgi:hypothetical protein
MNTGRLIQRLLFLGVIAMFSQCDDSGDFSEAHVGTWILEAVWYINNSDTTAVAVSGVNSLALKSDQSFIQVEEDWERRGTWRFSLDKLTLRYDNGGYDIFLLEVDGDWMALRYTYDYYGNVVQYVYEYSREVSQ